MADCSHPNTSYAPFCAKASGLRFTIVKGRAWGIKADNHMTMHQLDVGLEWLASDKLWPQETDFVALIRIGNRFFSFCAVILRKQAFSEMPGFLKVGVFVGGMCGTMMDIITKYLHTKVSIRPSPENEVVPIVVYIICWCCAFGGYERERHKS